MKGNQRGHTVAGDERMTDNERLLTKINQITQMGCAGIQSVMPMASQSALRQALTVQQREYQRLLAQARTLAKVKGLNPRDSAPMARHMSALGARMKLLNTEPNSKIADMMIQGNTRGMIQSLKGMRRTADPDPEIAALAQKLLETQINNIRSMEGFV